MNFKCNFCGFESNYTQMINHAKQTGHWHDEILKIPSCYRTGEGIDLTQQSFTNVERNQS